LGYSLSISHWHLSSLSFILKKLQLSHQSQHFFATPHTTSFMHHTTLSVGALALSLFVGSLTTAQAQFGAGSFTEGIPFAKPAYTTQPPITSGFQAFENQLDAEGSQRRLFFYPFAEIIQNPTPAPPTVNTYHIYARDTVATTVSYDAEVLIDPGTAAGFLTQINDMGALNFRYYGGYVTIPPDFSDPMNPFLGESTNAFIKASAPTTTYSYEMSVFSNDASSFLTQLNERGQSNWQWVSSVAPDTVTTPGTPITSYDLFVRRSNRTNKYTYRLIAASDDEITTLTLLNARGQEGYRWIGTLSFGSFPNYSSYELFMDDDQDSRTYQYKFLSAPNDVDLFISQANDEGNRGYSYQLPRQFGGVNGTPRNLYVTYSENSGSDPCPPSIGQISIDRSGLISFAPNPAVIFARYQLYRSTDLRTWTLVGDPLFTSENNLVWSLVFPTNGQTFYRVQGVPRVAVP
jgi:hypothetical protein